MSPEQKSRIKLGLNKPRQPGEPLRNARLERYCQMVASGIPMVTATKELYPGTKMVTAPDRTGQVRGRIEELKKEGAAQVTAGVRHSREEIIRVLWKNIDRGAQAEPVYDKKGNLLQDEKPCTNCGTFNAANVYKFDGNVVNKGIELAMKELGLGVERKETHVIHSKELAALSKGEIEQLLLETARQYGYRLVKTEEVREPDAPPPHRLQ